MENINFKKLFELDRKIKIAIVGSRNFKNFDEFTKKIDPVFNRLYEMVECIVSGGAMGTDSMAERYAKYSNINIIIHRPEWKKHGNSAGIIRNRTIIKNSDLILAFLLGTSKGTENSIKVARQLKKELLVFDLN